MGKSKTKTPAAAAVPAKEAAPTKEQNQTKPTPATEDEAFLVRAHELKEKGNRHFAMREHVQALACYAQALRVAPEGHADRAMFHSNRAACYLRDNQYSEAIHECNEALAVSPKFGKAMLRRAHAFEMQGDLNRALVDVRALLDNPELAGNAAEEAKAMQARIEVLKNTTKKQRSKQRALMQKQTQAMQSMASANGPQGLSGGLPRKPVTPLTLKVTLGSDTRLVQVPGTLPFGDLMAHIRRKFPEETGTLNLKYRDRDNQLITVTNRQDLLSAVATSLAAQSAKAAAPAGLGGAGLGKGLPPQPHTPPTVSLELTRAEAEEEVVEFDDWLLDFAELFREHLGIDADGHVDLHNEGLEKCNQALEAAVGSEAAVPLFEQAAAKFQEVAALALLNWGNVHMCQARRLFDSAGAGEDKKETPPVVSPEARKQAEEHYFQAEAKYKKALELKEDFYEAVIASGQQLFERAKLLSTAETKADGEVEALFDSAQAKLKEALTLIPETAALPAQTDPKAKKEETEAKKEAAKPKKDEAKTKKEEPESKKEGDAAAAPTQPDEQLVRSQVLVMWGNVLYEQSQVRAQQGKEWEALLDEAVAKFREAKCSEDDINGALLLHAGKKGKEEPKEDAKKETPTEAKKEAPKETKKEAPKEAKKEAPKDAKKGKGKGKK
mmetsp:Transcript_7816/g.14800  ORF Transcript_7816/g.14800 Transcript_7816/m.14800 type:complete len:667 (-) Transcript_7816:369-2369(-)|eukprot:CAMPEP_0114258800 /NCGR_PEP_ID=MMETSP0058-20121206/19537_1 /TAXON_ID=36894 /ORGANISM="Pyramimonas parkeae, CCMP726" /LENGTH=666 /DNA_ID=CAMNT_0001373773 /DNA_START=163 /DNA_END=2163 /DNA_ORIENTATION=+